MEANEIRVGNWLNDPRPLTEINKKYVNNPDNGYFIATARDIQYAEEFEPIPLTEEILLKCGFKEDGYYNSSKRLVFLNIILFKGNGYYILCFYPLTEIKYLHQLQNLYFALTDQELEINL